MGSPPVGELVCAGKGVCSKGNKHGVQGKFVCLGLGKARVTFLPKKVKAG